MVKPEILVQYKRDGLIDQEHYGYIVLADKSRAFDFTGDANGYPFYLRSCAKPLQASLIIENNLDLTEEEIGVMLGVYIKLVHHNVENRFES